MMSRFLRPAAQIGVLARTKVPPIGRSSDIHKLDREKISVSFDFGYAPKQDLSPDGQEDFKAAFHRELASVRAWWVKEDWNPALIGSLQVSVWSEYKISRALVPAWEGQHGRMEFPVGRVVEGKAAIVHELVHVFFPNGNRLLAEGLAIHLQQLIGGNPAFPNFGRPLHEVAREVLEDIVPEFAPGDPTSLKSLHLTQLDRVATPNPLALRVGLDAYGEEPRGQGRLYPIAGSFVQFLIDNHGLAKFCELYARTPLVPSQLNGGTPGRWHDIYGRPLAAFEAEWKSLICTNVGVGNA
jgi:hypothetical protein